MHPPSETHPTSRLTDARGPVVGQRFCPARGAPCPLGLFMRDLNRIVIFSAGLTGALLLSGCAQTRVACRTAMAAAPVPGVTCRAISADMRSAGPYTREAVVKELLHARAEGEMDFHISTTPPALQRPMCPLP